MNKQIPSEQRATVLSFDSLIASTGGVVSQPVLGRVADVYSYSTTYVISAGVQLVALPFMYAAKRTNSPADPIEKTD